jgi:hypothetical protein
MKNYLKIYIFITILFASCQKEITIDELGDYKNKIVLNGLIYADSTGRINVGRSIGILDNDKRSFILENANVTMTNGNNQNFFFQYDSLGYYSLKENRFNESETYEFTVTNDGYSTVSSSVTIPPKTRIMSVDTSSFYGLKPDCIGCYSERVLKLTMNLESSTNIKEYFIVDITVVDTFYYEIDYSNYHFRNDSIFYDTIFYDPPLTAQRKLLLNSYNKELKIVKWDAFLEEVFSDGLSSGYELYFEKPEGKTDYNITVYHYGYTPPENTFSLSVTVVSEDFYKHQLSLARSDYAEDDFLAEKVSIYTNIKEGMGILSGANQTVKIFDFSNLNE